jgi:ADP-ribose pyrophosphatase YjhB (NUDIX family)
MKIRDAFCNYCGTKFGAPLSYPRKCTGCGMEVWANPIPVSVALVPIRAGERTGLLVVRRAIPPGIGKLALPGGFLEESESWQAGCAREVREETGVVIDAARVEPLWFASSHPHPNRLLLFGIAAELTAEALPPHMPNAETQERGIVFGPGGIDELFVFSLHAEAARKYFAAHGVDRPHSFTPI